MIYPEQRADLLAKSWNKAEFEFQINILKNNNVYLAAFEEGFVQISLFEKILQIVKRILGGTNYTHPARIQATALKFFYHAEAHGFLNEVNIEKLQQTILTQARFNDFALRNVFNEMIKFRQSSKSRSEHLKDLRNIVTEYYTRQSTVLRPGLWRRFFTTPSIDLRKISSFGDAPLQLVERALTQKLPDPDLALFNLQNAFNLKNDFSDFQLKLADLLEKLEKNFSSQLQHRKSEIRDLWLGLGSTAFENNLPELAKTHLSRVLKLAQHDVKTQLKVGKLYLQYGEYELVQPFLPQLQKEFSLHFDIQILIGQAYWNSQKFDTAIEVYARAGQICPANQKKEMANIYYQIGEAYLNKNITNGTLTQAIHFLTLAVKKDCDVSSYHETLFSAYRLEWESLQENIPHHYGKKWFQLLALLNESTISKNKGQIVSVLLFLSEESFKSQNNSDGILYAKTAIKYFADDANVKIQVLEMAIHYEVWTHLQTEFYEWVKSHYSNPYLKEKIGDAHWKSNKLQALKIYEESLQLFKQHLSFFKNNNQEITIVNDHIAQIESKIGNHFFDLKKYDDAIKRLEKAASFNEKYKKTLFNAYQQAATYEKDRFAIFRKENKVIDYYHKMFLLFPEEKNVYLKDLMALYLSNKRYQDARDFFLMVQQQTWSKNFFNPAVYNELADSFKNINEYRKSLFCAKHAYVLEPSNQSYKKNYLEITLEFSEDLYSKIPEKLTIENRGGTEKNLQETAKRLESLLAIAEKFKPAYEELLVKIYQFLAKSTIEDCLLPNFTKEMDKEEVRKHKRLKSKQIDTAHYYYDKALIHRPKNSLLHFDKGILLEWDAENELALKEFEFAVQYQPKNPFYHNLLSTVYFVLSNMEKYNHHKQEAERLASSIPNFAEDYKIWNDEFMSVVKTKQIDPHTYLSKSWF